MSMGPRRKGLLWIIIFTIVFLMRSFLFAQFDWSSPKPQSQKPYCPIFRPPNDTDQPDCQLIINGDREEQCRWSSYHQRGLTDQEFIQVIRENRSSILDRYHSEANTLEEVQYPIAFSISMHKNVAQFERLLRLIYWPQNLYCVHVDARASNETKLAVQLLISNFRNVFLTKSEPVYWAGYGVLKAVLNCMNDTLIRFGTHRWRYFINLSGMDFPLKTNLELVRILKLLNGSNDVEFNEELQFSRHWFSYRLISDSSGYPFTHVPDIRIPKPGPPHQLKIYKGNLAATLSRNFVQYLFTDQIALDLIDWLTDTDTADEHLWSTLQYNRIAQAPGSYPAECHESKPSYVSRFVVWRGEKRGLCSGRYVRDVCIFGVKDVHHLTRPMKKELFANKFYTDYQSVAFQCMEHWFKEKTKTKTVQLNETYYATMPSVRYVNGEMRTSCLPQIKEKAKIRNYIKGNYVRKRKNG